MIYFDTDTFRKLGAVLSGQGLPAELRRRIALSSVAALEVLGQLSIFDAEKILRAIHNMRDTWLPEAAPILEWTDSFIAGRVFDARREDDNWKHIGDAIDTCLEADKAENVKPAAKELKDLLDKATESQAKQMQTVVEAIRKESAGLANQEKYFAEGVAGRAGVTFDAQMQARILERLSAYFEYQRASLQTALDNPNFNYLKHRNRAFDAEQLVYLSDPRLHFVTMDSGFECVRDSPQRTRIHVLRPDQIGSPERVAGTLALLER